MLPNRSTFFAALPDILTRSRCRCPPDFISSIDPVELFRSAKCVLFIIFAIAAHSWRSVIVRLNFWTLKDISKIRKSRGTYNFPGPHSECHYCFGMELADFASAAELSSEPEKLLLPSSRTDKIRPNLSRFLLARTVSNGVEESRNKSLVTAL